VAVTCFLRFSTVLILNFPVSGLANAQCFLQQSSIWILSYLYTSPLVRIPCFYDQFLVRLNKFL
jgi:hypothetical protein